MINTNFHVNKSFKEQVINCINDTFGALTQPFIKNTITEDNTSILALLIFHDTIVTKPRKHFRVLSCVIYTIIDHYICIGYLACQ